ncbi:hypothetical protein KR009_010488 [Drosophila setifemur]|nr:hypothetical protein KR009_010488 [Drosophila setifemur]
MLSAQRNSLVLSHVLPSAMKMLSCRLMSKVDSHNSPADGPPIAAMRTDLKKMDAPDKGKVTDACWQTYRRTEYKCRSDVEFNVPAFIDSRGLCLEDCALDVDPLDRANYKPHDMYDREYQRTWFECVVKTPRRKAHCVHKPPPYPRRSRQKTATKTCGSPNVCVLGKMELGLMDPCKSKDTKCPRLKLPNCCKDARNPATCRRPFHGGRCTRRKTQFPSFSECKHDPLPDARPTECNCLAKPAICDMWRFYRKKH